MFYAFEFESDVTLISTFDWNKQAGGMYPFGGGCKTQRTKLTPQQVLNRTVRLVVPEGSSVDWVKERCFEERFGACVVTQVGQPRYGKVVLKIVLPTEGLAIRITRDGIRLSMNEKVSEPISSCILAPSFALCVAGITTHGSSDGSYHVVHFVQSHTKGLAAPGTAQSARIAPTLIPLTAFAASTNIHCSGPVQIALVCPCLDLCV